MKIKYLIYGLLLFIGVACSDSKEPFAEKSKRTVLIYMAADNNLSSYGYRNIESILRGSAGKNLNNGNLLIYFDPSDSAPQLLRIVVDKQGVATEEIVKEYPEQNSASSDVMRGVINDVLKDSRFKADNYGLMLWSHGTAWLPYDWRNQLRSFGQDGSAWMEIPELAEAIPDKTFDFIIFDACYMASVEVIYALRNKANYIIGSPTEILANGFPYHLILEPMFKETTDLVAISDNFFNYYDQQSGLSKSATVSIAAVNNLPDLQDVTRSILKDRAAEIEAMSLSGLQPMDNLSTKRTVLYDFGHFIRKVATDEQALAFEEALEKVIIHKKTTPKATYALGGGSTIEMKHFSGLSIYIPQEIQIGLNDWYKTNMEWYQAVYE